MQIPGDGAWRRRKTARNLPWRAWSRPGARGGGCWGGRSGWCSVGPPTSPAPPCRPPAEPIPQRNDESGGRGYEGEQSKLQAGLGLGRGCRVGGLGFGSPSVTLPAASSSRLGSHRPEIRPSEARSWSSAGVRSSSRQSPRDLVGAPGLQHLSRRGEKGFEYGFK